MRIASSNILLSSTRSYSSINQIEENLRAWKGNRRPDFEAQEAGNNKGTLSDTVEISKQALTAAQPLKSLSTISSPSIQVNNSSYTSSNDDAKILILEKLLEQLTGKKIKLIHLDIAGSDEAQEATAELQRLAREVQIARTTGNNNIQAGFGIEYDRTENYKETERTTFSADGIIKTTDGKEIKINIDLELSREFSTHNEVHVRQGDAIRKDPLVINFDGNAAQLTEGKYSFDIDSDEVQDKISFVKSGSGFLTIDKNNDGVVNNGSELLGTSTGNGFAELAKYDLDNNYWIDEGDPIFNKLHIWTKNSEGADRLLTLDKVGVGAIYLGNTATQFSINGPSNKQLGLVQSTGIFLGDKGNSGTVQHIDLIV